MPPRPASGVPLPTQHPRRPSLRSQVSISPRPLFLRTQTSCTPSPNLGRDTGVWITQDTGVSASCSSKTQVFPVPSRQPAAFPTRRTPSLVTWLRGGYRARRGAGPAAQRGGPMDPGRARRSAGYGSRLRAPTKASRTWSRGDSAEGGAGSAGAPPTESRPLVQPSAGPSGLFTGGGFPAMGGSAPTHLNENPEIVWGTPWSRHGRN